MRKAKKTWKQILFEMPARHEHCEWCEELVNLNGFDYVCDGSGKTLHHECFNERLGIINEDRKRYSNSSK